MDMNTVIKELIRNAYEFEKKKNIDSVIQSLQFLSTAEDLSVFDPARFETAELYTLLHDLLTRHSAEFELVWSILKVLQVIVRNPAASLALVHTYNFLHPLTTLLEAQITSERKLVVLRVMQELSYGVVVCWKEAHLPKLLGLLMEIITSGDHELIPNALGVMVNLCHKNKPAIYTLMNTVDVKVFLRILLNLQRENNETNVQVCKMLMILNQLSGNVPDAEILSFVRMSFIRVNKAFGCGNAFLMRHIVDFFRNAKESEHGRKVLLSYPSYEKEMETLLKTLSSREVPNNWQCVQRLVEFMQELVDLELPAIMPLFTQITNCIFPWLPVSGVAPSALELVSSLLRQSRNQDEDVYKSLCLCLENHLQVLIRMFHEGCNASLSTSDVLTTLMSLLHLLRELAVNPSFSSKLAAAVNKEELKKVLLPLMTQSQQDGRSLFHQPVTALYVEVLSFVSELSMDDKEWLFLYSDLLQKKQILQAFAVALYSGSYEVKRQILYLAGTTSFSKECLAVLSKCLADLNQLFLLAPDPAAGNHRAASCPQSQLECVPYFRDTQLEGLDRLIGKLNDLSKNNQIQNAPLSSVIELYSYKVSEMQRAERSLQNSLATADGHCTHLSHRVAQLTTEITHLHQLLYTAHQTQEGAQAELQELRHQLSTAQESATSSHIKFKQLQQDSQSKGMIIKDQNEEMLRQKQKIEELIKKSKELEQNIEMITEKREEQDKVIQAHKQKILSLEENIEELHKTVLKLNGEKSELQTVYSKLEDKLKMRENVILEKEVLIENKISQLHSMEQELTSQQGLIKRLEKTIKEKEKEIAAQQNQLVDLERMRKIIFEITGGKKTNI